MIVRPGDFCVADIPFTDGSGSKRRPLLIARIGEISLGDAGRVKQVWASHVQPAF